MPRSDEEQYHNEKMFLLQNIIDGKFDKEIHQWAKDAKKDDIPLLIDFAVEMNGDWFSWSGYYNGKGETKNYGDPTYPDGPERFRDAYRHIINIFRNENVTKVTWFFHPDIYSNPNKEWNQPKYYYPGDEYIDWIGVSIYGPLHPKEEYWETFSEILEKRHKSIIEISKNKPFAILEFGVTDNHPLGKKDEWLQDAFKIILNNSYLDFKAISYWHETWEEKDNLWATLRIDSSEKTLETFKKLISNKRFISYSALINNSNNQIKQSIKTPKLLFKSGFEKGVYLKKPFQDKDGIWWQEILGLDVKPFSWPIFSDIYQETMLQLIVDYDKDIDSYIQNEIVSTIDKNGFKTKALHQNILKKQRSDTQDPYIIYTNNTDIEKLYIKYSMRFPKTLVRDLGKDGWTVLTEFKTTNDYRLAIYVYEDEDEKLYWYMHGDNVVDEPKIYKEYWYKENYDVPVPLGEWFDVEIFWNRKTNNSGEVLWKINSQIIANYNGPTKIKDPINAIMVFTNYASNPHEQWIDNVEIWDSIPNSKQINIQEYEYNTWYKPKPKTSFSWLKLFETTAFGDLS